MNALIMRSISMGLWYIDYGVHLSRAPLKGDFGAYANNKQPHDDCLFIYGGWFVPFRLFDAAPYLSVDVYNIE